jgi:hypothetical protein
VRCGAVWCGVVGQVLWVLEKSGGSLGGGMYVDLCMYVCMYVMTYSLRFHPRRRLSVCLSTCLGTIASAVSICAPFLGCTSGNTTSSLWPRRPPFASPVVNHGSARVSKRRPSSSTTS